VAISLVGSAAASATTVTIPAHQAGDLLVVFAFNSAAATAPTLPSGWTNGANGAANTCGGRVGYRIATASGTTSGTWTNANRLIVMVYRGNNALSVGQVAGGNGTGTSVTLTALASMQGVGRNKVVSFAGHRTATTFTDPSGLTRRQVTATAPFVAAWDSDNPATYTAKTTTSNTSSGWRGSSLEIIEALPNAKADTLVETFDTWDAARWTDPWGSGQAVVASGGEAQFTGTTAYQYTSLRTSEGPWDLTGSSVVWSLGAHSGAAESDFSLILSPGTTDTSARMDFLLAPYVGGYWIEAGLKTADGGIRSGAGNASLDTAVCRYLRMRESGGTLFWDYSADGSSWTNLASVAGSGMAVTALRPHFMWGRWGTGTDPVYRLQGINEPIVATPTTIDGAGSLTATKSTVDGSGTVRAQGTGSLTASSASLAGSGSVRVTGAGGLTAAPATIAASGPLGPPPLPGVGGLTPTPARIAGSGTIRVAGAGGLTATRATSKGTGTVKVVGAGSMQAAGATLAGSGTVVKPRVSVWTGTAWKPIKLQQWDGSAWAEVQDEVQ